MKPAERIIAYSRTQADAWRPTGPLNNERIHKLRVSLKRLRSMVNMMKHAKVETGQLNDRLRSWSRHLGTLRDQAIVEKWLHKKHHSLGLTRDQFASMARGVSGAVDEISDRLGGGDVDFNFDRALKKAYKKARTSWKRAKRSGDKEETHHLRHRVKHLQYQLESCGEAAPLKRLNRFRKLGQSLGDLHDVWIVENDSSVMSRSKVGKKLRKIEKRRYKDVERRAKKAFG